VPIFAELIHPNRIEVDSVEKRTQMEPEVAHLQSNAEKNVEEEKEKCERVSLTF
jgi:hypothetical protein